MWPAPEAPHPLRRDRLNLAAYFAVLTLALGFSGPSGVVQLPLQFLLKDGLRLGPQGMAAFEAIVLIPSCLGFLFGWLRDRWQGRLGDRRYFLIAAPVAIGCYGYLALSTGAFDYLRLGAAILVAAVAFEMMTAAAQAMMTSVARRHMMTGRLSAVDEFADVAAEVVALLAGGWLASHAATRSAFGVAVASTLIVLGLAFWSPGPILEQEKNRASPPRRSNEFTTLLANRGVRLALAVLVLWNFSPGWNTPLFYHLTTHVGLSPEAYGLYRAANYASMAAATIIYSYLCQRHSLGRLLRWILAVNVLTGVLFLLITGPVQAILIGVLAGLLTGLANVAVLDLARRSCPAQLEGTGMMLAFSVWAVAGTAGDLFGSWVYLRVGLAGCIACDILANALVLPTITRLPLPLIDAREGGSVER